MTEAGVREMMAEMKLKMVQTADIRMRASEESEI